MKYPKQSIIISSLIWLAVILAGFIFTKLNSVIIESSTIEIDASFVNESPIHSENKDEFSTIKKPAKQKDEKKFSETKSPNKEPKLINRPLPQIPDELRYEAYNSHAIARFYINGDGSASVQLIEATSNPKLNHLLLQSLKQWRFEALGYESTHDIRVDFKVE